MNESTGIEAIFPTLHACISRLLNRNMLVIAFRGSHTLIIHRSEPFSGIPVRLN